MLLWMLLAACGPKTCALDATAASGEVLVVGDSLLAWHAPRCRSVPDYLSEASGLSVVNAAVNGAQLTGGRHPIPEQYLDGAWSWVVMNGGGNDLNQQCECGDACEDVMDALIDPTDWSGAAPALAARALAAGGRVALMGYYEMPESAWYGLGRCGAQFDILNARYAAYAAATDGVTYIDAGEAMQWDRRSQYDFDKVHPDPAGASALAAQIAEAMAAP